MRRYSILFLSALAAPLIAQLPSPAPQITPADNLVVDGLPPIPASIAEDAGRYNNARAAVLWDWNPRRREMLIGTRFAEAQQLHLVVAPGGVRSQLTFFDEPVSDASYQPTLGEYAVFSKDVGGAEFFQKYRLDFATGQVTLLTDGTSRNVGGVWSHSGTWYAYGSTRRDGRDVDLWVMNPADPRTDRMVVHNDGGGFTAVDWSPDDRQLLVEEYVSANESYLWLVDAGSGARTPLTPRDSTKVSIGHARFSADGQGVYLTTDRESEFHRLAYFDLATKSYRYLTSGIPWDIDEFELSRDGSLIAFVSNEDGLGVLHVIRTVDGKAMPLPPLPVGVVSGLRWSPVQKGARVVHELGFSFTSAQSPEDVYSLEVEPRRLTRWTTSETGGRRTGDFQNAELVHWPAADGRQIPGFLYMPPARFTGKRPVIINIHGGPEGQSRPVFLGRNNYYLDELGVALLFPNIRGSTGYGKSYLALDNGVQREGAYQDIGALLDWIRTRPDLDADKVLVTGGSYGGHMTLVTATRYNDRICCSVDVVGISNLATFLEHTSGYRQDLRRVEYGSERDSTIRAWMERTAPLNNAQRVTKPLFVVQGMNDPRVPRSEAEQMVAAVRRNGAPVWYLMAKDEGHGFRKKKNVDFQFYATVFFARQYLLAGGGATATP